MKHHYYNIRMASLQRVLLFFTWIHLFSEYMNQHKRWKEWFIKRLAPTILKALVGENQNEKHCRKPLKMIHIELKIGEIVFFLIGLHTYILVRIYTVYILILSLWFIFDIPSRPNIQESWRNYEWSSIKFKYQIKKLLISLAAFQFCWLGALMIVLFFFCTT
jgi:hypothetical protein